MIWLFRALLVVAALINFAPLLGAFLPARMEALYGIPIDSPNLEVLLRHRAVLFGVVGGLLFAALAFPGVRKVAYTVGFVSMLSFLVVAAVVEGTSEHIGNVVRLDVVGLVALAGAVLVERSAKLA